MISVGETLRRERLRTGLDLERIAQDTKISVRTLELIEGDQFEKLPGGVFARSFVRQYARAVGVDEEEIVGELDKMLAPPPEILPKMRRRSGRRRSACHRWLVWRDGAALVIVCAQTHRCRPWRCLF